MYWISYRKRHSGVLMKRTGNGRNSHKNFKPPLATSPNKWLTIINAINSSNKIITSMFVYLLYTA